MDFTSLLNQILPKRSFSFWKNKVILSINLANLAMLVVIWILWIWKMRAIGQIYSPLITNRLLANYTLYLLPIFNTLVLMMNLYLAQKAYLREKMASIFLIIFDFYWLVRAIIFGGYLISGYLRIKRDCRVNWITRMKKLKKNPKLYLWSLIEQKEKAGYFERKRLAIEIRKAKKALKIGFLDWEKIFQVVILPTFKEPLQVLSASINSYLNAEWPNNRLIVVVAMEEREGEEIHPKAKALQEEFGGKMHKFMITYHPADIVGELKGKGANSSWAAGILKKYLSSQKIADENILVSNFDV